MTREGNYDIIIKLKGLTSDSGVSVQCVGGRQESFLHLLESCALPTSYIENCDFFSGAPVSPCCGCTKQPCLLHLHPWPPSDKLRVHPFHWLVCCQIECHVCRPMSPMMVLPMWGWISRWLAHCPVCYWNHYLYISECSVGPCFSPQYGQ